MFYIFVMQTLARLGTLKFNPLRMMMAPTFFVFRVLSESTCGVKLFPLVFWAWNTLVSQAWPVTLISKARILNISKNSKNKQKINKFNSKRNPKKIKKIPLYAQIFKIIQKYAFVYFVICACIISTEKTNCGNNLHVFRGHKTRFNRFHEGGKGRG